MSPVSESADQTYGDIITTGKEAGLTEVRVCIRGGLVHIYDRHINKQAYTHTPPCIRCPYAPCERVINMSQGTVCVCVAS